jgi:triphosphoribosyl-dephospho-CoA synthase
LKPGNVHRFGDGHGMTVRDFAISASVTAPVIGDPALPVGAMILAAVEATQRAVGCNTNLGILLLCAPIAVAARGAPPDALPQRLAAVLHGLTVEDAAAAFAAIALAAPAGLGRASRHDVRAPPTATLLDAMIEAAPRDRIARQYAAGYADVLGIGLPAFAAATAKGHAEPWAATAAYLTFLATFPDSHIARKHGPEAARTVRREAAAIAASFAAVADPADASDLLLAFDRSLKARNLNPGTAADLTVAAALLWLLGLRPDA